MVERNESKRSEKPTHGQTEINKTVLYPVEHGACLATRLARSGLAPAYSKTWAQPGRPHGFMNVVFDGGGGEGSGAQRILAREVMSVVGIFSGWQDGRGGVREVNVEARRRQAQQRQRRRVGATDGSGGGCDGNGGRSAEDASNTFRGCWKHSVFTVGPHMPSHKSKSAAPTPRPPNAFFLFKSSLPIGAIASFTPGEQISTVAGLRWRGLSESERQNWMDLARQKAKEHKVKYPDYKFTPQRGAARTTRQRDPDPARCNHIASLLAQGLTESALRDEMEIFDKTRPPRAAVFEFASPILAENYQTFAAGSATALPLNCADEPNVSPIGAPNGIESSEGALYHGGPTVSDLARQKAKEHKVKYPDYKFTPQRGAARTTRQRDPDPARCNHIASLLAQGLTESALRDEMEIFDKTRPPRAAVFEFASPILAENYQTFAAGSATALPLNCADEPNVSPIGAPNGIESSEGALYHGGPTVSLNSAPLEFVPASTSCFVAAAPGYALSSPDLNTGSLLHRPQGWLSEITSPSHIDAVTDMDAFGATAPLFMSNLFKFIGLSAPPTSTELEDFFGMLCNL
ncbi:hypothetical protein C8R46DRAFT_1196185 [Mycena filopes]|nr:hypothetical protein C8R46DRAFT_1196185 [Mycena filopes]